MSVQEPMTITAYGETMTVREWSEHTGIPTNTIRYRLSESGMPPEVALAEDDQVRRDWRWPHVAEEKKRALKIFRRTKNIHEVARRLERSPATVHDYLRERGVSVREMYRKRKRQAWRMCYREGKSFAEIGRHFDVHPSTAAHYVREAEKDPSLRCVDEPSYCDCGRESTICVKVKVRQGAKEVMELCPSCYELFLEIENK